MYVVATPYEDCRTEARLFAVREPLWHEWNRNYVLAERASWNVRSNDRDSHTFFTQSAKRTRSHCFMGKACGAKLCHWFACSAIFPKIWQFFFSRHFFRRVSAVTRTIVLMEKCAKCYRIFGTKTKWRERAVSRGGNSRKSKNKRKATDQPRGSFRHRKYSTESCRQRKKNKFRRGEFIGPGYVGKSCHERKRVKIHHGREINFGCCRLSQRRPNLDHEFRYYRWISDNPDSADDLWLWKYSTQWTTCTWGCTTFLRVFHTTEPHRMGHGIYQSSTIPFALFKRQHWP